MAQPADLTRIRLMLAVRHHKDRVLAPAATTYLKPFARTHGKAAVVD